jgi:hypothetical protein
MKYFKEGASYTSSGTSALTAACSVMELTLHVHYATVKEHNFISIPCSNDNDMVVMQSSEESVIQAHITKT